MSLRLANVGNVIDKETDMPTLVAIGYPHQGTAEEARETAQRLEADLT
jgi:hypothetical protein